MRLPVEEPEFSGRLVHGVPVSTVRGQIPETVAQPAKRGRCRIPFRAMARYDGREGACINLQMRWYQRPLLHADAVREEQAGGSSRIYHRWN